MGRTPGSKNARGLGANGFGGGGRKTLINGRKGPGRSNLSSSNGLHSKMNGNTSGAKGSHGPMKNRDHEGSDGSNITTETPVDYTNQVNFPYEVRLNGFSTLLETTKSGTPSVRKLVMDECDIIMECRICRSLFRSLPNFLKHKKSFCTEKFQKISPGGLTHLMKLAADSFKINGGTKLSSSPVRTTMPNIASDKSPEESTDEASGIQSRSTRDDSSFDLNNVIPMLTRATREKANGLRMDEQLRPQHEFRPSELKLLDNTTHYQGYSRHRKVDFQDYVSSIQAGAHAKRIMHDTVLLGPDAEVACAADPDVIGAIVQRLHTKAEEKRVEQEVKEQTLKCPTCQTWYDTEKSLRMHVRTHAVVHERPPKKRKSAPATATTDTETTEEESNVPNEKPGNDKPEVPVQEKPDPDPLKLKQISTTPMTSRSLSKEPSVEPDSPKPVASTSSLTPKPGQVQNKLKSKAKSKLVPEPPILYSNSSVPTKGRRTNNSFSATFNSASLSTLLPSLTPVSPTTASTITSRSKKPSGQSVTSQGRTRGRRKSLDKTLLPEILTCMKCEASFHSKSEMSRHLASCTGVINFSLSTSQGLSSTPKISILDRQEYHKISPVSTKNLPTTSSHVGSNIKTLPISVKNHDREEDEDMDKISVYTISSDDQDPEKINEEIESYLEEAGASKMLTVPGQGSDTSKICDDDEGWDDTPDESDCSPRGVWYRSVKTGKRWSIYSRHNPYDPPNTNTDDCKTLSNTPPSDSLEEAGASSKLTVSGAGSGTSRPRVPLDDDGVWDSPSTVYDTPKLRVRLDDEDNWDSPDTVYTKRGGPLCFLQSLSTENTETPDHGSVYDPPQNNTDDSISNTPLSDEASSSSAPLDKVQSGDLTSSDEPMETGNEDPVANVPNSSGAMSSAEMEEQYSDTPPVLDAQR